MNIARQKNEYSNMHGTIQEIVASKDEQICSTCMKKSSITIRITDLDYDGRTFLEKIKACVYPSLEIDREKVPSICRVCISTINLSFKFRRTALTSLKKLKLVVDTEYNHEDSQEFNTESQEVKTESQEMKSESDFSDDHISFSNDNEFAETTELNEAVLLITKLTEGETNNSNLEFNCKECSLTFSKKSEHDTHMITVHNKKIACDLCGKAFKVLSRLKEHVMSHSEEKSFNCSHCDKSFIRMSSLKRHMTSHYAPPGQKSKKTPFLCTICGKNFPFSNGATRHMRIHFGIKTHQCQICHKQFNQSTHLQVHMRTHSGEKPYICEVCGESFTLKAGLHKHSKTKHAQEENRKLCGNNVFSVD